MEFEIHFLVVNQKGHNRVRRGREVGMLPCPIGSGAAAGIREVLNRLLKIAS